DGGHACSLQRHDGESVRLHSIAGSELGRPIQADQRRHNKMTLSTVTFRIAEMPHVLLQQKLTPRSRCLNKNGASRCIVRGCVSSACARVSACAVQGAV